MNFFFKKNQNMIIFLRDTLLLHVIFYFTLNYAPTYIYVKRHQLLKNTKICCILVRSLGVISD